MRRSAFAIGLVVLFGCGGSLPGGFSNAAFLGTWNTANGTTAYNGCAVPPATATGGGTVTIVSGPSGGVTTQSSHCDLNFTLSSADTGTLAGNQNCSNSLTVGGNTLTGTATFTTGTLSLTNGTITYAGSGTVLFTYNGASETCNFTQTGTFTQ